VCEVRRESFRKERKDSGQAGMTDNYNEFMEFSLPAITFVKQLHGPAMPVLDFHSDLLL